MSDIATFGAGMFWYTEQAFRAVDGVLDVSVGYMGGTKEAPTYEEICAGGTGHAEVAQVTFDPGRVSYAGLLETFWTCHNPTTLNRQGPNVGDHYRSVIFCHSPEQVAAANASKAAVRESGRYRNDIVTAIEVAGEFYRAGEEHQNFVEKQGQPA